MHQARLGRRRKKGKVYNHTATRVVVTSRKVSALAIDMPDTPGTAVLVPELSASSSLGPN